MGVVGSKSPLERRNTVLRRSQRKSIHGIKGKTDKITKNIKKFKGTEEDADYIDLKAKIEGLERDLKLSEKNLQPQLRNIHRDALKRIADCYNLLDVKLAENQQKLSEKEEKLKEKEASENKEEEIADDVFIEEMDQKSDDESEYNRRTVELKLVQVELMENSPQVNKRASIAKMGVPVMPGTMLEALNRRTYELEVGVEKRVAQIRETIEELEVEISQFIGKKNGKYYSKIKGQLEGYSRDLDNLSATDDAITEQIRMCRNYVMNCLSFLEEKAVDDGSSSEEEEVVEVPSEVPINNLSPRSMRTTYI